MIILMYKQRSWLLAIVGSTVSWAVADLVLDVTIGEAAEHGSGSAHSSGNSSPAVGTTHTNVNKSDTSSNPNNAPHHHNKGTVYTRVATEEPSTTNNDDDDDVESTPSHTSSTKPNERGGLNKRNVTKLLKDEGLNHHSSSSINTLEETVAMLPSPSSGSTNSPSSNASSSMAPLQLGLDKSASQPATHLSGDQDTALAGIVTVGIVYLMCAQRWMSHLTLAREFEEKRVAGLPVEASSGVGGVWSPFHDLEWWLAALGGLLLFWHYQTLYWAYDTAPSTVINPLLQVSSTWVLLGTAIPAAITGSTFIRPFDLFCYMIIVFGGLLPSIDGDIKGMFRAAFWRQSFVKNAVLSEISLGLYDLLLAYVVKRGKLSLSEDPGNNVHQGANIVENEFFFLAWCWFVVSFAFAFGLHPRLYEEYVALRGVSPKILALGALGQIIMFAGYFSSAFAYSWFYQASVVHAAEASMAQMFNLILAFACKRYFNLGRDSAVKALKWKIVSVVVVSCGLFLIALQDVASGDAGGGHHGRR